MPIFNPHIKLYKKKHEKDSIAIITTPSHFAFVNSKGDI